MILIEFQFLGLSSQNNQGKEQFADCVHPAREDKPQFVSGSKLPILNDAFQNNVPVVNIQNPQKRQEFSCCSLILEGSGFFYNCYAFGPKHYSAGGALCCSESQVYIALSMTTPSGNSFEENSAKYGGSIAIFSSDMLISRTKFYNDLAYLAGGSIFASSGTINHKINKTPSQLTVGHCFFDGVQFSYCQSKEFCGAIGFNCIEEIYLKDCFFQSCQSGHTAGALGIINSFCIIDYCRFVGNSCGNKEVTESNNEILKGTYKKMRENLIKEVQFPKGGGAILIWSEKTKDYWNYPSLLETVSQNCCYATNFIAGSTPNQIITKKRGDDILIAEYGILRSYNDQYSYDVSDSIILENHAAMYNINSTIQSKYCGIFKEPSTPNKLTYVLPNITFTETNILFTEKETNNPIATLSDQSLPNTKIPKQTIKNPNPKSKTFTISGFQRYSKIQSPTPTLSQSPTASTGRGTPGTPIRTHIATSYSKYSWDAEPSASSLASRTSSGRTWATQTPSIAISSPTQSTGKGTPIITQFSPSKSWWGEEPKPTGTASISFENEPTQSELPSQTSSGQTWPSVTLYIITQTPTASTGVGTPIQSMKRPTISYWGEIPSVTPFASASFIVNEATPKASQTNIGRTWPTQTLSFSSPTASTGMATPDSTSYSPSQSWFGEIPNITPVETISFLFEPSFSEMATQTSSGRTWPTQTATPKRPPTASRYGEKPLATTFSPTQSYWGEIPVPSPTVSISFDAEAPYPTITPEATKRPSMSKTLSDATVVTITISPFIIQTISVVMAITFSGTSTIIDVTSQSLTYNEEGKISYTLVPNAIEIISYIPGEYVQVVSSSYLFYDEYIIITVFPTTAKSKEFALGAIIGIVIGCIVLVAVSGIVIYSCLLHGKKNVSIKEQEKSEETSIETSKETISFILNEISEPNTTVWPATILDGTNNTFKEDFEEAEIDIIPLTTIL